MEDIVVRYLHFIGIISLASMLVCQNFFLSKQLSGGQLRKLAVIDAFYGISAIVILLTGLSLWLWVGKPSDFYTKNMVFHIKFSLFLFVALLSIMPTIFFVKNRKSAESEVLVPTKVILLKRLELVALVFIPLLAVLMAQGVGYA